MVSNNVTVAPALYLPILNIRTTCRAISERLSSQFRECTGLVHRDMYLSRLSGSGDIKIKCFTSFLRLRCGSKTRTESSTVLVVWLYEILWDVMVHLVIYTNVHITRICLIKCTKCCFLHSRKLFTNTCFWWNFGVASGQETKAVRFQKSNPRGRALRACLPMKARSKISQ